MPKIETALREKTAKEKLQELKEQAASKRAKSQKITLAELEERVEAIEDILIEGI